MSEEKTEQAVIEDQPDEQAAPVAEGGDAQDDDLEKILAEYNEATSQEVKTTPEKAGNDNDLLKHEVEELRQRIEQTQFQNDITQVVSTVRGDLENVPEKWVRGWIAAEADDNPKLQQAWENRHKDPSGFKRVVNGLHKQFAKEFSTVASVDANATEDREAVANAVRGSSNKAPEGDNMPDFASMTDAEAREAMKKMGIPDPGF